MSLSLLVALGLSLAGAPASGPSIRLGDRVATSISPAGDEDRYPFEAAAGTRVRLRVKAGRDGLDPALSLYGPDGAELPVGGRSIVLPETGRYVVAVRGRAGTTGAYELRTKGRAPRRVRLGPVSVAPGEVRDFPVRGERDARWTVRIRAPRGSGLRVLSLLDPGGAEAVGGVAAFGADGRARRARVFLSGDFGEYRLRLGGTEVETAVRIVVRVKTPRFRRARIELSPAEPRPVAVSPASGPAGTRVRIDGEGFSSKGEVLFDGVAATHVELGPDGALAATVPGGTRANVPLAVTVRNPDGQENGVGSAFTLVAPPFVSLVVPGRAEPGDTVTVLGARFEAGAGVLFEDRAAVAVAFRSDSTIEATVPEAGLDEGPVDVTVVLPDGGPKVSAPDALVVEAEPRIGAVIPSVAIPGATVRIAGNHLVGGTKVEFADLASPVVALSEDGSLSARVPATGLPFGAVDVTVTKPFGGRATLPGGLTVVPDTSYKGLLLTGIIDGPRGSVPKAVELYATVDIPDLSAWGLENANNGNTLAGPVFTLSGSAKKGDYLWVASETPGFRAYFGYPPTATDNVMLINGNDVVALYKGTQVVDIYGRPSDVTGAADHTAAWDYLDSYAYRKDHTRPSASFDERQWTIAGTDALDVQGTSAVNGAAGITVPFGTYRP